MKNEHPVSFAEFEAIYTANLQAADNPPAPPHTCAPKPPSLRNTETGSSPPTTVSR